ncbi:MAG TPA: hypothetical protein QF901_10130, partial [Gammaproteobacteria bacterium]|nr:hypothetical protein [Gammaproteobacteria bacterium]
IQGSDCATTAQFLDFVLKAVQGIQLPPGSGNRGAIGGQGVGEMAADTAGCPRNQGDLAG